MPWGSCPCPGVEMRGSPPLAPPLCVCGEIYLTLPYLGRGGGVSGPVCGVDRVWARETIAHWDMVYADAGTTWEVPLLQHRTTCGGACHAVWSFCSGYIYLESFGKEPHAPHHMPASTLPLPHSTPTHVIDTGALIPYNML